MLNSIEDAIADIRAGKRTLLVRMGWMRGMTLHNILILGAYLTLGAAVIFGLEFYIALPALLTLPLGLLQIWQMRRIADGGDREQHRVDVSPRDADARRRGDRLRLNPASLGD